MAQDAYIGEISMFAGNFAPRGWSFCNGQLIAISSNSALFSILGTTYGGDGRTTFALPDLRSRSPIHAGHGNGLSIRNLGDRVGNEQHYLLTTEMPSHNHLTQNVTTADQHILLSTNDAVNEIPQAGDVVAIGNYPNGLSSQKVKNFGPPAAGQTVNGQAISGNAGLTVLNNGGGLPHNNMQPSLAINYIICLFGIYPSRS